MNASNTCHTAEINTCRRTPTQAMGAWRWLGVLVLGAAACGVHAEILTFRFEGSLTQDPFGLSDFGAPVSGHYSFDSLALDEIPAPAAASYTSVGPAFGFSVEVDGTPYATVGSLNIGIQAGNPGAYLVTGVGTDLTLELTLYDDTGIAVTGEALPLQVPSLSNFHVREFRLFAPDAEFVATLQLLQGVVASVPEPGSASLLLVGIAAVLAWRSQRRRGPPWRRIDRSIGGRSSPSHVQGKSMRLAHAFVVVRALALLAVMLYVPQARAVDGVVLLDQNRAFAGGVTPGDAAGFPITISLPGSYRLASNLSPPAFVTAIEITVADVTIDLNGFSLIAPPHDLSRSDIGVILRGTGVQALTLRNGHIHGFAEPFRFAGALGPAGTLPPSPVTLKDLTFVITPGLSGVDMLIPPFSRVEGVSAPAVGLVLLCPSLVSGSAVRQVLIDTGQSIPGAKCAIVNNATN